MNLSKNKVPASLIAGGMGVALLLTGIAAIASAQSATTSGTPIAGSATAVTDASLSETASAVDKPESANDAADNGSAGSTGHHQSPPGGDGIVSNITGATIVMAEESKEGSASYTVDAGKATVTSDGSSASLSDIKVGDKIFVKGAVRGTNVAATSISLDHQETGGPQDAGEAGSANDPADAASGTGTASQ